MKKEDTMAMKKLRPEKMKAAFIYFARGVIIGRE
jgi:hypothetical protein